MNLLPEALKAPGEAILCCYGAVPDEGWEIAWCYDGAWRWHHRGVGPLPAGGIEAERLVFARPARVTVVVDLDLILEAHWTAHEAVGLVHSEADTTRARVARERLRAVIDGAGS